MEKRREGGESLSQQMWTPSEPEQSRPQKAAMNQSTSISSVLVDLKKTKQQKKKNKALHSSQWVFTMKIHISLVPKMEEEEEEEKRKEIERTSFKLKTANYEFTWRRTRTHKCIDAHTHTRARKHSHSRAQKHTHTLTRDTIPQLTMGSA